MEEREDDGGQRPSKRLCIGGKTEEEQEAISSSRTRKSTVKDCVDDQHWIAPSPVVHVRGLGEAVVEADLVEALQKFGNICYVMMMPFKRQALVEFDSVDSAEHCVSRGTSEAVRVADQRVFFNFSTSKRITRPVNPDDPAGGNKVLLLSVQNPLYPITTDVLHAVCNPVGNVLRIVIFRRNGIQAMVEFESVVDARRAKLELNGADIYAGCCTLKIEYARPNRLNVIRNDSSSWDYRKPLPLHQERGKRKQRQAILGDHPSNGYDPQCPLQPTNSRYRKSSRDMQNTDSYAMHLHQFPTFVDPGASSSVTMVSGLHPAKMNCSRVFNLFCLYGNVKKVKFMRSIPGTSLVEMGDEFAAYRGVSHLNGIRVFGTKLNVCVSKQQEVIPSQVFELPDGSNSYQDFSLTRNNRFSTAQSGRNIIQAPAAVLHFYNAPPTFNQHQMQKLCSDHDVPVFVKFKAFDAKSNSKTLSGLLEFENKTEAAEALTVLNHHQIWMPNTSNPFTLKLCFSTSSHL